MRPDPLSLTSAPSWEVSWSAGPFLTQILFRAHSDQSFVKTFLGPPDRSLDQSLIGAMASYR